MFITTWLSETAGQHYSDDTGLENQYLARKIASYLLELNQQYARRQEMIQKRTTDLIDGLVVNTQRLKGSGR